MTTPGPDDADARLDQLVELVVRLASGDLDARIEASPAGDRVDAIAVGLGMLAEELQVLTEDMELRVAERTRQVADAHRQLERLALYDQLTGLANRTLLSARLDRAVARAERRGGPPAVLVLDLDGFKVVNDSFGHSVGDLLLVEVARRLRSVVRDIDTVARLGGDEFAVVISHATVDQVVDVATRIQQALQRPVQAGAQQCWVGTSIGIRLAEPNLSAETLLRDADTAMYVAKGRGRGGIEFFESTMHATALRRVRLADELRAAITDGQLQMRYQSIVELGSGRIAGVEALVRWQHPVRGLLTPDQFISVAEDTGLVVPLDGWVLETAIAQVAKWRSTVLGGSDFGMHVNISPLELRSPAFADDVLERLGRHRAAPGDLVLEVTETQLLGEDAQTALALEKLRAAGVGVAIDDFGSGYSSIGYMRRQSVDTIKIDRSLITDLDTDPQQLRVAAAILGLVEAFGLTAVAEGVETPAQAARLHALGCRYGQGFLWGRPVRTRTMSDHLRARAHAARAGR
ncbi:putative bifunctional diguanylate cyclase/phosphodiesterase [Pseudonocardia humida]|uniref:EAL domain-containing protein n=1 Tax=Pseudonocardia humida TaxID=2800819 RepID=A0ABT1AAP2_9PSEU|nr:EAL domain-containing protein [Pseudonocardia humida]MCO1660099.1 EAL domain-containing protein [Pseudonocardia humida]